MELIITTATAHDTTDLLEALTAGTAQVHSVREDGTLRRRHFLTAKARQEAEWVRVQRTGQEADEAEGIEAVTPRSMDSIATELHMSVAAVRRILIDLAITEELEDMEEGDLESLLEGAQDN